MTVCSDDAFGCSVFVCPCTEFRRQVGVSGLPPVFSRLRCRRSLAVFCGPWGVHPLLVAWELRFRANTSSSQVGNLLIPIRRLLSLALFSALLFQVGCSSSGGGRGSACIPHKGMSPKVLVQCGCVPARSGGGSVMIQGYGASTREAITMVHYICPRGEGKLDRVVVVNGVVDRVLR